MIGGEASPPEWGNRFYLKYDGSAPNATDLNSLASGIATAWSTDLAALVPSGYALNEVDVLDITTLTGASGTWTGSHAGTRSATAPPINCALGIEYKIARRYRGGKPRIYLVAGDASDVASPGTWTSGFTTAAATAWAAFMTAVTALSPGSMGVLSHINLSYYSGFQNFTKPSGREYSVPKYRATALSDTITGYSVKTEIQSQRRRRTSTSP